MTKYKTEDYKISAVKYYLTFKFCYANNISKLLRIT